MASQLGKVVSASLKNPELRDLTMSVLTKLTLPPSLDDGGQLAGEHHPPCGGRHGLNKAEWRCLDDKHDTWIQIIVLLGRNGIVTNSVAGLLLLILIFRIPRGTKAHRAGIQRRFSGNVQELGNTFPER
jgi:hypothetical protein